jgi:hypothetical protein
MKYQSEIIKNLIENNGHYVTSKPHYEVECINEIINDVRGSYPKLCDYMGEWMNYANEHVNIGKFPIERVTDVTNARFENVVPYDYKSAILKGQSLVNLVTQKSGRFNGTRFLRIPLNHILKSNVSYFVKFNLRESTLTNGVTCRLKNSANGSTMGGLKSDGIITIMGDGFNILEFYITNANDVANGLDAIIDDIMLIEYQQGMENWVISYFEGMQSVRMPVLTTTNEDGTKTNILTVNEDVALHSNGGVCDELDLLSGQLTQRIGENNEVLTQEVVKTVVLSCLDENNTPTKFKPYEGVMYVQTSSETLPPLLDMEVPVEAINQNLTSFIK